MNTSNTTRTEKALRNIIFGIVNTSTSFILPFVIRTILIYRLGMDYVGIGSLFTSILQILNVTELGFASAIIYSMYEPVANDDKEKIIKKIALYKSVYRVVGIVILAIGILLLPFLKYLIKGTYPEDINLYVVYGIYLLNTLISYFMYGYKSSVLIVYQRNDLVSKVNSITEVVKCIIQIILLLIIGNFYVYIIVIPIMSIISNLLIEYVTNKYFPEYDRKYDFSFKEISGIKKQLGGIAIGRISLVCRNAFDSIIISALFGISLTAVYSNYYYVFSVVSSFLFIILSSISAGVGNSLVMDSVEKNERDHRRLDFYYEFLAGVGTVCLFSLYQPFMYLWAGEDKMFDNLSMCFFCVYFYTNHLAQIRSVYSEAAGLWWHFRFFAIGEMIANLVLNFVLGYYFGINGILFATIITAFVVSFVACSYKTYKVLFKTSAFRFFLYNAYYAVVTSCGCIIVKAIVEMLPVKGWLMFIVRALITALFAIAFFVIMYSINHYTRNCLKSLLYFVIRRFNKKV